MRVMLAGAGMFDGLKRSYAKLSGEEEAGVLPSIAFGVASAFTGQMVAFPLESIARRLQARFWKLPNSLYSYLNHTMG